MACDEHFGNALSQAITTVRLMQTNSMEERQCREFSGFLPVCGVA